MLVGAGFAGADPFHGDRLGRLSISKAGLQERDRVVVEGCRESGIPVAVVMGGGYAPRIEDSVDIHFATVQAAHRAQRTWPSPKGVDPSGSERPVESTGI